MTTYSLTDQTTVAAAIDRRAAIGGVLNSRGTACVGCGMSRFCTLREVAAAYQLPWETLIRELRQAAADTFPNGGTNA